MISGLAAAQRFAHLGIILGGIGSLQPNAASYITSVKAVGKPIPVMGWEG